MGTGNKRMREADEQRWSALMASAQSGNESDYRQLLGELSDVVQRFLSSRFGNRPIIEDCVQEALIAIHQARHTYNPKRPFRPWLFAIVRNRAIDTLRKQKRRDDVAEQYTMEQEVLAQPNGQTAHPREIVEGSFFRSLSDQHREVLVLTKIIGFSIAETAEKLHISESAVKVRVHRAIGKLRKLMKEDEW
jgi:RNA polymerase sigma-70 factor, ECF subfamily